MVTGYPDWKKNTKIEGDFATATKSVAVDTDGRLYTLMLGANGEGVAVDDDGNMKAVLLGDYGGVLKTIAVDSFGRLNTMALSDDYMTATALSDEGDVLAAVANRKYAIRGIAMVSRAYESTCYGATLTATFGGAAKIIAQVAIDYDTNRISHIYLEPHVITDVNTAVTFAKWGAGYFQGWCAVFYRAVNI